MSGYGPLADVYEWLIPDSKLTPAGSVSAFADLVRPLPRHAHVLDCSCGTGQLAVGLADLGLEVVASDASARMVRRTRDLAAEKGVALRTLESRWDELRAHLRPSSFDLVFCVGNSLAHAEGASARKDALAVMAQLVAVGGRIVLTSRNWELVRAGGSRLDVRDQLVRRGGHDALVVYGWQIAEDWHDKHHLEIAVALIEADGSVRTCRERLSFWPFSDQQLVAELRDVSLTVESSTFDPAADAYMVVARRA